MSKERCLGCRATLPTSAAFCPTCGRANTPVLLDDVSFDDPAGSATVEFGGGPGRRGVLVGAGLLAAVAAIVVGLAVVGSGSDEVAEPAPTTTAVTTPPTTTTRATPVSRSPRTTTTLPAVAEYGSLLPGLTTGRRLAVLSGGAIREIDLDTGRSEVVIDGVRGDRLVVLPGVVPRTYVVVNGERPTLWTAEGSIELDPTGSSQFIGGASDRFAVINWSERYPDVQLFDAAGTSTALQVRPGLWPAAVVDEGLIMQSYADGVYLQAWDGSVRRVAFGAATGVWPGGVHSIVCDDAYACSIESRSMTGEVLSSTPTDITCCSTPRAGTSDVALVDRDGLTEILVLGSLLPPIRLDTYVQSAAWWPDEQALLLFDGANLEYWDRTTAQLHRVELPEGLAPISAAAPIG